LQALLEVQPDFQDAEVQKWDPDLKERLNRRCRQSLEWLQLQFNRQGFNEKVENAGWYGPGFYAAAIELFDHPSVKASLPQAGRQVALLAAAMGRMLQLSLNKGAVTKWDNRFPWHIGQVLVTWREKRLAYKALKKLDPLMKQLFNKLKKRQGSSGAWENPDEEDQVYYTVRALSACYVNTEENEFLDSESIALTHKFLLGLFRKNSDGLLLNPKASINALEAFQKLFDFRIRNSFPNLLLMLPARLNRLGLLDNILNPLGSDSGTLKRIRACARVQLEEQGKSGLELLGVNDRLYQSLKGRVEFLKEFAGERQEGLSEDQGKREEILHELRRFLSSTLTEMRSKSSRRLIAALWQTDGFLNFIPLIQHLSDLEQDRAFYKYYRDHLNHEVLLFLLGAYIYYNCATFRKRVDDEILDIYEKKKVPFQRHNLEGEFLFRWKLISTFHDIGYLFEVEPFKDKFTGRSRSKEELLRKSFRVVDEFRENFLFDYLMQYIKTPLQKGQTEEENETAREKEVRQLAQEVARKLQPYRWKITRARDLAKLTTGGNYADAFKLISQYVKSKHISEDLIEDYFKLCSTVAPKGVKEGVEVEKRPKFYDHGIMSALVLLKATDVQRHYLKELTNQNISGTLLYDYPQLVDLLDHPNTKAHLGVKQFFIRFSHVAGAIALHNINPRLYMQKQCRAFDAKNKKPRTGLEKAFYTKPTRAPGRYIISLRENPLAYLTALADTLQDWDRHSFRRISFGEDSGDPLSSSEVVIDFSEDQKINVKPLTREAREKYLSLKEPEAMDQYLLNWRQYVKIGDEKTDSAL
jgi:hypothetical protein